MSAHSKKPEYCFKAEYIPEKKEQVFISHITVAPDH